MSLLLEEMFADKNIQKSCSLNIRAQVWCIFFFFMYYSSRTSCARYILTFLGLTSCTSEHKESKRAEALFPGDPCPVSKPPTRSCIFIASPNYHSPLAPRFQVLQEGQRRRVDPNSSRLGPVWGCEAKRKESRPREYVRISEKQCSTQLRTPNCGWGS